MLKTLIIIPTYNEAENITELAKTIFALNLDLNILVVDDNSPDGTANQVLELQLNYPGLHLLKRDKKDGLGRAYLAGFAWAREYGYEAVVQMDADFSHSPKYLPAMLQSLETNDFVIGSRYVKGGGVINWPVWRQLISRGGGLYARLILGLPIKDLTGGFNAWRLATLDKVNLPTINSNGYSFQIELKAKAAHAGCSYQETPIIFAERRLGQSKLQGKIITEAIWRVWQIKWKMLDKKTLISLLAILLLTVAVYQSVFTSSFLKVWDDQFHIIDNPDIQALTTDNLKKIFTSSYMGMYQPIASTIFMLGNHYWQGQAPFFHLLSVLLHLTNIFLVFKLSYKITNQKNWSLLISAIFALHPLQVESVAWISAITVPLSSLFILWGSLKYLNYLENTKKNRRLVAVGALFFLALLSKSASVIFFPLLFLFDWWQKRPLNKKLWLEKIPFFGLSIIFGLTTIQNRIAVGHNKTVGYDFSWLEKLATASYALWLYLKKIILPLDLSPYYTFPKKINGQLPWFYWLPLIFFVLFLCLVIIKRKQISRLGKFALWWIIINLILVLNLIKFSPQLIAERYTYLAMVGIIIFLVAWLAQFLKTYPSMKPVVITSFGAYLVLLMFIGWRQTAIWQSNNKFLDALVSTNVTIPDHHILRARYAMEKDPSSEEALNDTTVALLLYPNYIEAHQVRLQIFFNRQEFTSALWENNWLMKVLPNNPNYYLNQGIIWLNMGDADKACSAWKQGMAIGLKLEPQLAKLCSDKAD